MKIKIRPHDPEMLQEPAVHLTPVGLLKHLRIMRADLDFHLGAPPVELAASAV